MICSVCGKPLSAGVKFCSHCGSAVNENTYAPKNAQAQRRLTRPLDGRMIAGVCAGLAQYLGWDVSLVRAAAVLAIMLGIGTPVVAYAIAWLVIPDSPLAVPMQPAPPGQTQSSEWQDVPRQ